MEPQEILPHQLRYMGDYCKAINGGHAPPLPPQLVSLVLYISAILWILLLLQIMEAGESK